MRNDPSTKLSQARAFNVLALAAVVTLCWIASPVGVGLFLGSLLAFTLQPSYGRLRGRGWSATSAALVCVLGAMTLLTASCAGFAVLFITRGVSLAQTLPASLAPGGPMRATVERLLHRVHVHPDAVFGHVQERAMSLGTRAAGIAADVAGFTFAGLLTLFFMGLATYYVLHHWGEIVRRAEVTLPFAPRHTRALFNQFRRVGSEVLRGTIVTGLLQGAFAGFGYWVTGVPDPTFFGALTAIASLVPAVGTLLVWVPAGIYLILSGHLAMGIAELVWGTLVVGILTDYVIRPRLVGHSSGVPTVLTFVSLFGGVEVFGVIGLVLGPVIVTLCVAVLTTYEEEVLAAASQPHDD